MLRAMTPCLLFSLLASCLVSDPSDQSPLLGEAGKMISELATVEGELSSYDVHVEGDAIHLLLTFRRIEGEHSQLFYTQSVDQGHTWTKPTLLDIPPPPQDAVPGNAPQVAGHRQHVLAVWTTRGIGYKDRGLLNAAFSTDGGSNWKRLTQPADWPEAIDQGFLDLASDSGGNFHLVWLDAREGQKGLQYARFDTRSERWSSVMTIDKETCECCWNRLLIADQTIYVLYRDIQPRDMGLAVSKSRDEAWDLKGPVGEFEWQFDGCPHVGGGLAREDIGSSTRLHSTVWTGKEKQAGVYYLLSFDRGSNWADPELLDPFGRHSDIATGPEGQIVAVWDSMRGGDFSIYLRVSNDSGTSWDQPEKISSHGVTATYPRLVDVGAGFLVFWLEQVDGGSPELKWTHLSVTSERLTG